MIKNIQSKFSIKQVVVIPIVTTLFVCFLISIISFLSIKMAHDGTPLYETPIWVVLVFGLLLFWSIPYYLKMFKQYVFLDNGFEVRNVFGKEFHSWNNVKKVSIIENRFEKFLWQYLEEDALSIYLKNGEVIELFSKYYKNTPVLRRYFKNKNDLKVFNSYDSNFKKSIKSFDKKVLRGSFMLSFNGFLIMFFILLSGFMLWHSWLSMTLIGFFVLLSFPTFIILIFGFQSYWFEVDGESLIVKNHIFLNFKKQINLEQVRVICFEQKFKKEPTIRIIYNDYKMISFQSNSLKNKQWKSLMHLLKEKNVNIVDELFYELD